jgi:hypothetical protein
MNHAYVSCERREKEGLRSRSIYKRRKNERYVYTNMGAVNIVGGSCRVTVAFKAALSATVLF